MNNPAPKISIIVPVYNSEEYLLKCLDSLIYQTYENLEIICINDGSTDNSQKILEEYKAKDSRIRVYEQPNKGQSAARNYAMTIATGEYVSFVDSDDWVLLTLYKTFAELNYCRNVDIFNFNAESYLEKTEDVFTNKFYSIKIWNNHKSDKTIHKFNDCNNPFYGNISACNKIYNLHFLRKNRIKFLEKTIFEDQLFHIETLLKSKSILATNETFYRYRKSSPNSTTQTLDENVFDIFIILENIERLIRENRLYEEFKYALLQYKYEQMNNMFKKIRFSSKAKFFEKMQNSIREIDLSDFDMTICEQLANFHIYNDILHCTWTEFSLGKRFTPEEEGTLKPVQF